MQSTALTRAAIYIKEATGYSNGENSKHQNAKTSALTKASRSPPATTTP